MVFVLTQALMKSFESKDSLSVNRKDTCYKLEQYSHVQHIRLPHTKSIVSFFVTPKGLLVYDFVYYYMVLCTYYFINFLIKIAKTKLIAIVISTPTNLKSIVFCCTNSSKIR